MRRIASALVLLVLAACQSAPPPKPVALPHYTDVPPYRFDVDKVEIVEEYISPFRLPNIEHQFPVPPAAAAKRWASERLQASGNTGRLVLTVTDAKVLREELPTTQGVKGKFTDDQAERYNGTLVVTLKLYKDQFLPVADGEATITASRTVTESASPAERDAAMNALTAQLITNLNTQMESNIPRLFGNWLR